MWHSCGTGGRAWACLSPGPKVQSGGQMTQTYMWEEPKKMSGPWEASTRCWLFFQVLLQAWHTAQTAVITRLESESLSFPGTSGSALEPTLVGSVQLQRVVWPLVLIQMISFSPHTCPTRGFTDSECQGLGNGATHLRSLVPAPSPAPTWTFTISGSFLLHWPPRHPLQHTEPWQPQSPQSQGNMVTGPAGVTAGDMLAFPCQLPHG